MSDSIDLLRTMLSEVTAFQDWVDAEDAAGALTRIYLHTASNSANHPHAVITDSDEASSRQWDLLAGGSRNYLQQSGRMCLMLEDSLDDASRDSSGEFVVDDSLIGDFRDAASDIVDGISELAGLGGYLAVNSIATRKTPTVADAPDEGLIVFAMYDVGWGLQG